MSIDLSAPEIQAAIALVDAKLDYELRSRKIPGISAGIVSDQTLIWSKGYGHANVAKQIVPDARTIYRVASISKLFTSTMMMILRDEGKLSLDDPLEKYVPAFRIKSPFADARPPTFRMVAAHAAGLPREGSQERWKTLEMMTGDQLLASLAESEMLMPTMTEPKYSNLGIAMLGYTLGKVAGMPYEVFVKERILTPLGMLDSGFNHDTAGSDQHAVGYYRENGALLPMRDWNPAGWNPAGGLHTTVADISKFMALQFSDAPAGAAPSQILGSSTLREMHMPVNVTPDFNSGYGIGFSISRLNDHKLVGHSGSVPGYRTSIELVPTLKLGVITFTNTTTDPVTINRSLLEILMPAFEHQQATPEATQEQIAAWKPYIGRYDWPTMDTILDIRVVKGYLTALVVGEELNTYVKLAPVSAHTFRMIGGHSTNETLRFEVDEAGQVTGLQFGGYPYRRLEEEA